MINPFKNKEKETKKTEHQTWYTKNTKKSTEQADKKDKKNKDGEEDKDGKDNIHIETRISLQVPERTADKRAKIPGKPIHGLPGSQY